MSIEQELAVAATVQSVVAFVELRTTNEVNAMFASGAFHEIVTPVAVYVSVNPVGAVFKIVADDVVAGPVPAELTALTATA